MRIIERLRKKWSKYRWTYNAEFRCWEAFLKEAIGTDSSPESPLIIVQGYSFDYNEAAGTHQVVYVATWQNGSQMEIQEIPRALRKCE